MTLISFFDKLNKNSLYLLFFLIPIFFLPFTLNVLDFPKQVLASFLIILSFVGWLAKGIFSEKFIFKGNKIFYLALILIFLSVLASSFFSVFKRGSFLGHSGDINDHFIILFSFLILVFLLVNSFEKEKDFLLFLFFGLLAFGLAGIFNLLQIYGIFVLPYDFSKLINFNTVGTPYGFAILAAVFLPICLILTFFSRSYLKIIFALISFILFLNIFLVNFKTAWTLLIFSILFLFIFGFSKEKKLKTVLIVLLMAILITSFFFYFFRGPFFSPPSLGVETNLAFPAEYYILKEVLSQNIKNFILGTGPGTFIFDYSKYRPQILNESIFWGTRFNQGSSLFFDWFITKGLLGGLSLLFFYFLIFYFSIGQLIKRKDTIYWEINLGLSAGLIGLIFVSFIYPFNFTTFFVFWLLAGGVFLFSFSKIKEIKLSLPIKTILANAVLMVFIVFFLWIVFYQGKSYLAENNYLKGVLALREGNIDKTIDFFTRAIKLNSFEDLYWRELSQVYLTKSNLFVQDPSLSNEEKIKLVNNTIAQGGNAISMAISINPVNVANWNVRGFFYRNLIGIQGAEARSLESYQKAIELEPNSPFAYGEKGRVFILIAQKLKEEKKDDLSKENLELASKELEKAINLKSDYVPAHYLMAVVYDQLGNLDEAIAKLKQTQEIISENPDIAFQLGLLYWRKNEIDNAFQQFEKALSLAKELKKDYPDARYMLALTYERKGEKEKAKEEFKKLLEENPDNKQLKKILENIEKNLPALEGIISSQSPFSEIPSEIKKSQP